MAADQGTAPAELREIEIARIGPRQAQIRKDFNKEELHQLAASIAEEGIIEPIVVQPVAGAGDKETFEIIAGERRWRAAKIADLRAIPCIVRRGLSEDRAAVIHLVENLQRSDLKFAEVCNGVSSLVKLLQSQPLPDGVSALDLAAERIGQSKAWVSRHAAVQGFAPEVQKLVGEGRVESVDIAHDLQKLLNLNKERFEGKVSLFYPDEDYDPDVDGPDEQAYNEDRKPTRADLRQTIEWVEDEIERKKSAQAERNKTREANKGKPKQEPVDPTAKRRQQIARIKPIVDKLKADLIAAAGKISGLKVSDNYNSPISFSYEGMSEYYGTPPASAGKTKFTIRVDSGIDAAFAMAKACGNEKQKVQVELPRELSFEAARKIQAALGSTLKVCFSLSGPGSEFCTAFKIAEPPMPAAPGKQPAKEGATKTAVVKGPAATKPAAKKAPGKKKAAAKAKKS